MGHDDREERIRSAERAALIRMSGATERLTEAVDAMVRACATAERATRGIRLVFTDLEEKRQEREMWRQMWAEALWVVPTFLVATLALALLFG